MGNKSMTNATDFYKIMDKAWGAADGTATTTSMGSSIAKQEPVKLGRRRLFILHPKRSLTNLCSKQKSQAFHSNHSQDQPSQRFGNSWMPAICCYQLGEQCSARVEDIQIEKHKRE
jgi:hypothetical protein